ncbi:MAG TPA: tetratricopeptide repeat protein [Polyangiaceae bacterium]|jgi:tetratricopeptide (TPR) repeat protein
MRSRRRLCAWALVACIAGVATTAAAPHPARAEETSPANVAAARKHFEKARGYYGQGAYREAIGELEAAHALDPNAKDLVFNLGVVHEKLADIDDALKWFRLYTTMNLTPAERERADAYTRRLEGAKKELDDKRAAQLAAQSDAAATVAPPPPPPEKQPNGRIDGYTIGAVSVTVAGVVFGTVMAVKAKQDQPRSPFVTGRDGTYADLVNRQDNAHREAVFADIGFGVSLVAAAAAAYLYLARPKVAPAPTTGSTTVSAGPLTGGGALFVQGSF